MEVKRFGNPAGKKIMLLHGNLMCWRQFEDVIPLPEAQPDAGVACWYGHREEHMKKAVEKRLCLCLAEWKGTR